MSLEQHNIREYTNAYLYNIIIKPHKLENGRFYAPKINSKLTGLTYLRTRLYVNVAIQYIV